VGLNIILRLVFQNSQTASEWYAVNVYPLFVWLSAQTFGRLPFSVFEILVVMLVALFLAAVVRLMVRLIRKVKRSPWKTFPLSKKEYLLKFLTNTACVVSALFFAFLIGCEVNYHRAPFSEHAGLSVNTQYSRDELLELIDYINEQLAVYSQQISTDSHGALVLEGELTKKGVATMQNLAQQYPFVGPYYSRAKPFISSELFMSNAGIVGIFSPLTIEANYNSHMPNVSKPFTVCHEMSHLSGFMREDEANFIAFLACRESGEPDFIYSGYVQALKHSINAYFSSGVDEDEYRAMYAKIPDSVKLELALENAYWEKYREEGFHRLAIQINDAYLKANSQPDGVQSYGRMVDLLISDYKGRS